MPIQGIINAASFSIVTVIRDTDTVIADKVIQLDPQEINEYIFLLEEKATKSATSSGLPKRYNGIIAKMDSFLSGGSLSVIPVATKPGATAFTVIFREPISRAMPLVKAISPHLEAA